MIVAAPAIPRHGAVMWRGGRASKPLSRPSRRFMRWAWRLLALAGLLGYSLLVYWLATFWLATVWQAVFWLAVRFVVSWIAAQ